MLNNSLKRESVKASGAIVASIAGGPIGGILAAILGVSVEALGLLGEKRTKELFDSDELIMKVSEKIQTSDDFAGFIFSIWQKHNLESSKERRKLLKRFLEQEVQKKTNDFVNFSKIEHIIQNISFGALRILNIIHSDIVQKRTIDPNNGADKLLNDTRLVPLVQSVERIHEDDILFRLNELGNYELLWILHDRMDGPFYRETKLGYILLEYISS
jgi:hypothetical protein